MGNSLLAPQYSDGLDGGEEDFHATLTFSHVAAAAGSRASTPDGPSMVSDSERKKLTWNSA